MSYEIEQYNRAETFLPELPPATYFEHFFYEKVAAAYWSESDNPDRVYLSQFVIPVAQTLNPQELLGLADLIKTDFPDMESRCGEHTETIWNLSPKNLTVDEQGEVYGRVGNVSEVVEFLNDYFGEVEPDDTELESILLASVWEAASKYKDVFYADDLTERINAESDRRSSLPPPGIANSDQIDIQPSG